MIEKLTDNVYVETGVRGCNHGFVVTSEGVVMIDTPQFPSDAVKWLDQIARFGPVRYILNTESHHDHYSGNYFFEGSIISHEGTRRAMQDNPVQSYLDLIKQMEPSSLALVANYSFRLPTITLTEKMTLYIGQHTFQLMNFPGHTPFQLPVYVPEEKVLFTSDNVVNQVLPYITPMADPFEWLKSLERMQQLDAQIFVPGHGSVSDKTCLPAMIAVVNLWMGTVSEALKKGLTLEEAQNRIDLRDRFPVVTGIPERVVQVQRMNVATIYGLLKENKP